MRAAGLRSEGPYPGKAVTPWQCFDTVCERTSKPSDNSVQQGKGCPFCAGNRVDPAEAVVVMIGVKIDPHGPYPGAHMPWPGTCRSCGEAVTPTYSSVKFGRGGCRRCGHDRTGEARRMDPDVAWKFMVDAGLRPLVDYPGSREKLLCRCVACENEVEPTLDSVRNSGSGGCVHCASGGYDTSQAGAAYLIRHEAFGALKIGIRNLTSRRLEDHQRYGWTLVDEWAFSDGTLAPDVESSVLDWWRNELGAPIGCQRPDNRQRRGLECWTCFQPR